MVLFFLRSELLRLVCKLMVADTEDTRETERGSESEVLE